MRHEERHAGASNYSIYKLIRLNFDLITGFSLAPLQAFTMFAMACSAGSFPSSRTARIFWEWRRG